MQRKLRPSSSILFLLFPICSACSLDPGTGNDVTTGSGGEFGTGGDFSSGGSGGTAGSGGVPGSVGGTASGGSDGSGGTNVATGGSTAGGPFDVLIEEGSPSVCGHLADVATTSAGFTGAGYLKSEDRLGVGVSWIVDASVEGSFDLGIRYESDVPQAVRITVGHDVVQQVELPATGGSWETHELSVTLRAGQNHVSLVSEGVGLAAVDSLAVRGAGITAGDCTTYQPGSDVALKAPTFVDQSVHDPSVIEADGTYYVFGSHLAAAKTTDFMRWDLIAGDGVNAQNPLFDNVVTELSEAFAYSTVTGLWAADVLRLRENGRFLMYYNSCEGSSPLSAMGIASSENAEGPYQDEGIFMTSGGSGYNASVLPNAIDPDAFYAPDGSLWMVYGSYSGGIFIMEMDEQTGFPEPEENYGTHLLGGNHIQIEGPYIQYSPHSGYYYLFTSYGGLAAGDGYNMRMARATTPRGPYFDHNGVDQATFTSNPYDASGVKVMGDHEWAGTGGHGYVSPGHNSTYFDEETGKYFLIFHARFPGQGNFHRIRVHEMYVNVDGWLVAAPLRYAPREPISGSSSARVDYVGLGEIPGSYQFINHGRDTSGTIKTSVGASLGSDGTLTGAIEGTWRFGGNNVFVVTAFGEDFRGVISRQWNETSEEFQVTFTGVSGAGETLWAVRTGH